MDYEFRIKLLETELTHMREMQQLLRERQDTADGRLDSTKVLTDNLLIIATKNSESIGMLTEKIDKLTTNVNNLVGALLRQNPN
jgi:hypothetical protein